MTVDVHTAWYLSRSSGLVAWSLLTLSLCSGSLFSARTRWPKANWNLAVHRHLSVLAFAATLTHVVVLLADPWLKPGVLQLLVAGQSAWRTAAVAAGQVALYLLTITELSGWLRPRLNVRTFRALHLLAVPAWLAATVHLLEAGPDTGGIVVRTVTAVGALLVLVAATWRLGASAGRAGRRRPSPTTVDRDPPARP